MNQSPEYSAVKKVGDTARCLSRLVSFAGLQQHALITSGMARSLGQMATNAAVFADPREVVMKAHQLYAA